MSNSTPNIHNSSLQNVHGMGHSASERKLNVNTIPFPSKDGEEIGRRISRIDFANKSLIMERKKRKKPLFG